MPSVTHTKTNSASPASPRVHTGVLDTHIAFFPILTLSLVLWLIYRSVFGFPVWFDETVGKALFFGVPVWLYIVVTQNKNILNSLAPHKMYSGIMLGLAVGGIFGFVTSIVTIATRGTGVQSALLFGEQGFWFEFALALCTAFWETIFFFSFVMTVVQQKFRHWSLAEQVLFVASIFLIFHIPNTFLRFGGVESLLQVGLLFVFALGQALLFSHRQNAYALIVSHAFWGMILLTHAGVI